MADSKLTPDAVRHVAKLASTSLAATSQSPLNWNRSSPTLTRSPRPTSPASNPWPTRSRSTTSSADDVVEPSLPLDKVLQNAPDSESPFFRVPKIIGQEEDSAG